MGKKTPETAGPDNEEPGFFEAFFEKNVKTTFLLWLLLMTSMVLGHSYFERSAENPALCASCHMSKEVFLSWQQQSDGNGRYDCFNCHKTGINDSNRRLLAYMAAGAAGKRIAAGKGSAAPLKEVCKAGAPWPAAPGYRRDTPVAGSPVVTDPLYGDIGARFTRKRPETRM